MATIQIPLRNDLDAFDFNVALDGRTFNFEIQWNTRSSVWSLIVRNDSQVELIGGVPLVVNSDLLGRFVNVALPPGVLTLFDTSGQNAECGKEDLGVRCVLLYQESEA